MVLHGRARHGRGGWRGGWLADACFCCSPRLRLPSQDITRIPKSDYSRNLTIARAGVQLKRLMSALVLFPHASVYAGLPQGTALPPLL